MKRFNYIMCCSLVALLGVSDTMAGIRVGNLSHNYAGTNKNKLAVQQQYYNAVAAVQQEQDLPIEVADASLAEQIRSGDETAKTNMSTLNRCAMIYPDGEFVWDKPTIGSMAGSAPTCVAVVEMRVLAANGSTEYTTVARGKLAAGDSINCNISRFPSSSYLPTITQFEFPADNKPTREDVVKVMNEEQKNKAGLKIAAAALAAGIAGNMVGKSAPGSDSLFGTNKDKLKTTAGGMLLGGGLMAASTYSGKVAGDVILNAGVNAAAGGVVGNMSATGDAVLRVENCVVGDGRQTTCLWGNVLTKGNEITGYYDHDNNIIIGLKDGETDKFERKSSYVLSAVGGKDPNKAGFLWTDLASETKYTFNEENGEVEQALSGGGTFYEAKIRKVSTIVPAVLINFKEPISGMKMADWNKWKEANPSYTSNIYKRDSRGNATDTISVGVVDGNGTVEFTPIQLNASDGSIIDLSNKARLGSTLKGAGLGGAVGGLSGYQGAQDDIEDRFVLAVREYNDSLSNFYCGTGTKFLSFYNDDTILPAMRGEQ